MVGAKDYAVISFHFQASPEELQKISHLFQNDAYKDAPMTGIHLEGVKYLVPLAQETLVFGKKAKGGVFVAKTNTGKFSLILLAGAWSHMTLCFSCTYRFIRWRNG